MTVTHSVRFACAVLLGLILLLVDAIPTAAHAELESSGPADRTLWSLGQSIVAAHASAAVTGAPYSLT